MDTINEVKTPFEGSKSIVPARVPWRLNVVIVAFRVKVFVQFNSLAESLSGLSAK